MAVFYVFHVYCRDREEDLYMQYYQIMMHLCTNVKRALYLLCLIINLIFIKLWTISKQAEALVLIMQRI